MIINYSRKAQNFTIHIKEAHIVEVNDHFSEIQYIYFLKF